MAEARKRTFRQFLKRNFLYIILLFLALALVALIVWGAFSIIRQLMEIPGENTGEETTQTESGLRPFLPAPDAPSTEDREDPGQSKTPDEPDASGQEEVVSGWQENGQFVQPFEGTTTLLEGRRVALTYDETRLQLTESNGVTSLTGMDGEAVPRLDLQQLSYSLYRLSEEELSRLAVGIFQAYYADAPATDAVSVTKLSGSSDEFRFSLSAPAGNGADAMRAEVSFFQTGDEFWYAVLLRPEQDEAVPLLQAYENIKVR